MIKFILSDIEGTTTDKSFVYETLFPYFKENMVSFIKKNAAKKEVAQVLQDVKDTVLKEDVRLLDDEEAIERLIIWTNIDRKHTALKQLQGSVWKAGYQQGTLAGHVYSDVVPALQKWHRSGIGLGIYSSGSVSAQKLLFRHSIAGDLTPLFSQYFDTHVGHKQEITSYQNIQQQIGIPAEKILFLSDVEGELEAAAQSGMKVKHVVRKGTVPSTKYDIATNFSFSL
jgi:enolase-phosphatase E1